MIRGLFSVRAFARAVDDLVFTRGDLIRGGSNGRPEALALGVSGEGPVSDGTDLVNERPRAAVTGDAKNLVVQNNSGTPASQIDVDADEIVLKTADGGQAKVVSSVDLTADLTASGADGLDTGAEAISTWYYVWVIYNPTTDTTASLLSTSATAPTMPSGYTYKALISAVLNDSGGDLLLFWQAGKQFWSADTGAEWQVLTAGVETSPTAVDLSAYVSPIAVAVTLTLELNTGTVAGAYACSVFSHNDAQTRKIDVPGVSYDANARRFANTTEVPMPTAQTVYYTVNSAASSESADMWVRGWRMP